MSNDAVAVREETIDTPAFRQLAKEWGYATFDPVNIIDEIARRNFWTALVAHVDAHLEKNNVKN